MQWVQWVCYSQLLYWVQHLGLPERSIGMELPENLYGYEPVCDPKTCVGTTLHKQWVVPFTRGGWAKKFTPNSREKPMGQPEPASTGRKMCQ